MQSELCKWVAASTKILSGEPRQESQVACPGKGIERRKAWVGGTKNSIFEEEKAGYSTQMETWAEVNRIALEVQIANEKDGNKMRIGERIQEHKTQEITSIRKRDASFAERGQRHEVFTWMPTALEH